MKSNRKAGSAARRERRASSPEFKAEAIRLVVERRALGVPLSQIGRHSMCVRTSCGRGCGSSNRRAVRVPACRARRSRRTAPATRGRGAPPGASVCKKSGGVLLRRSRVEVRRDYSPSRRVQSAISCAGSSRCRRRATTGRSNGHRVGTLSLMNSSWRGSASFTRRAGRPTGRRASIRSCRPRAFRRARNVSRGSCGGGVGRPARGQKTGSRVDDGFGARSSDRRESARPRLRRNGVGLNRVWIADITYVPTREGLLYLATVLDLGSRRRVGWAMRDTIEDQLTVSALRMACAARGPVRGLILHRECRMVAVSSARQATIRAELVTARDDCQHERQRRLLRQAMACRSFSRRASSLSCS